MTGQGAKCSAADLRAAVLQHLGLQASFRAGSNDLPKGLAALIHAEVGNGHTMPARMLAASHHAACTIAKLERLLQVGHLLFKQ